MMFMFAVFTWDLYPHTSVFRAFAMLRRCAHCIPRPDKTSSKKYVTELRH